MKEKIEFDDDDSHINIESLLYMIADYQRDIASRDKRIAALEGAVRQLVNELEQWSLTENDPESVEAIKAGKDALAATGYLGEGK